MDEGITVLGSLVFSFLRVFVSNMYWVLPCFRVCCDGGLRIRKALRLVVLFRANEYLIKSCIGSFEDGAGRGAGVIGRSKMSSASSDERKPKAIKKEKKNSMNVRAEPLRSLRT